MGRPANHLTETEIKEQIYPATYQAEVGIVEMVLDVEEIARAASETRSS